MLEFARHFAAFWAFVSPAIGGTVVGCSTNMVVAGGRAQSCEVYNFQKNSWSTLPGPKSISRFRQLIAIDGMLIAGGETSFETLDLSTPELIHKLVQFATELDLFSLYKKVLIKHNILDEIVATKRATKG